MLPKASLNFSYKIKFLSEILCKLICSFAVLILELWANIHAPFFERISFNFTVTQMIENYSLGALCP